MSKTKQKYNRENDYGVDETPEKEVDRRKQKRFERALKTKNIDDILALEEDEDFYWDDEER